MSWVNRAGRALREQWQADARERANPQITKDRITRNQIAERIRAEYAPRFAALHGDDMVQQALRLSDEQARAILSAEKQAGLWGDQ